MNTEPRPDKKIQAKKRNLRKPALNIPMESLPDTLQLDEPTSVSPADSFQKYVVAQNEDEFHVVLFHFSLLESPQNYAQNKLLFVESLSCKTE